MIQTLIEILQSDEWLGESEAIEIAKGKYHFKTKTKDIINQYKRRWQILKKR